PVPQTSPIFIHLLSGFLSSSGTMFESQPPSAALDSIAAALQSTIATCSTIRCRKLDTAVAAAIPDNAAVRVAYHRLLNRTSRIGPNSTNQKFGETAIAVISAIFGSGMCTLAINCGITKFIVPLANPSVALVNPISHTGGRRCVVLREPPGNALMLTMVDQVD